MTAEIAIMNRQGIALAADSAVTVRRERVWKTANKLFSLAPHNDIAIMAFGSGDFLGFPWDTIVKSFRLKVGQRRFKTVQECAIEFFEYLREPLFSGEDAESLSIMLLMLHDLERLKKAVGTYNSKAEFRTKLKVQIKLAIERAERSDLNGCSITKSEYKTHHSTVLNVLAKDVFKEHLTNEIKTRLLDLSHTTFTRNVRTEYYTGIVIAGFGENEFFPTLLTYTVDGKHNGHLRVWRQDDYSHDLNDPNASPGVIIPFGQADIATLFLEGISPKHVRWIRRTLKALLDNKSNKLINDYIKDPDERTVESALQRKENSTIIRELDEEFESYRDKGLVQPVMKVVATLPKEEMADMAEALVEITSLRRRVDSPLESVGGPTDVAIISKGDGLVWIKRKHYFDPNLNLDFHHRKELQYRSQRDEP